MSWMPAAVRTASDLVAVETDLGGDRGGDGGDSSLVAGGVGIVGSGGGGDGRDRGESELAPGDLGFYSFGDVDGNDPDTDEFSGDPDGVVAAREVANPVGFGGQGDGEFVVECRGPRGEDFIEDWFDAGPAARDHVLEGKSDLVGDLSAPEYGEQLVLADDAQVEVEEPETDGGIELERLEEHLRFARGSFERLDLIMASVFVFDVGADAHPMVELAAAVSQGECLEAMPAVFAVLAPEPALDLWWTPVVDHVGPGGHDGGGVIGVHEVDPARPDVIGGLSAVFGAASVDVFEPSVDGHHPHGVRDGVGEDHEVLGIDHGATGKVGGVHGRVTIGTSVGRPIQCPSLTESLSVRFAMRPPLVAQC